jgi:hypothetical protein
VLSNDQCLDDGFLIALLPHPRQKHGGVLVKVLVDGGKGSYDDEMTRE